MLRKAGWNKNRVVAISKIADDMYKSEETKKETID